MTDYRAIEEILLRTNPDIVYRSEGNKTIDFGDIIFWFNDDGSLDDITCGLDFDQ